MRRVGKRIGQRMKVQSFLRPDRKVFAFATTTFCSSRGLNTLRISNLVAFIMCRYNHLERVISNPPSVRSSVFSQIIPDRANETGGSR